jgi:ubiquitin-conjugating enzyme E2 variant
LILVKSIVRSLLADFATGIFHFFVDVYGSVRGRFMKKPAHFLWLQHTAPYKMVAQLHWELTGGVYKIATVIFGVCVLFGVPWELLLFLVCCANGNRMHRWSQQRKSEAAVLVRNVQRFKIIQNKEHHNQHHNGAFNKNYCVMTNVMNPILHRIRFWEFVIRNLKILKIHPANGS